MISDPDIDQIAYWLNKDVLRALRDYDMIQPGERVLAAVSGGKDSLAMLCLLDHIRKNTLFRFDLVALHVHGDARGPDTPEHKELYHWLQSTGVEFHIRRLHINENEPLPMNCHRCSRSRRRTLFEAAQELGCRSIALGHHADDLAQSTLMNFLLNGRVEGMAPVREFFDGSVQIIRPMIYLRERSIRRLAEALIIPQPPDTCPYSFNTKRKYMSDLLHKLERDNTNVFGNLTRLGLEHTGKAER